MSNRSHPEAAILRASVALMYLGGRTLRQIADACGVKVGYVGRIVSMLRDGGMDLPRRKGRKSPGQRGLRGPRGSRGPMPQRRAVDYDDILDAWADGMMARDIALLTRRSLGSVKEIVRRARNLGDVRAIHHRAAAA